MQASCVDVDGSHPPSSVLKHSTESIRRLRDRNFCHRGGALYRGDMAVMSQWGTCPECLVPLVPNMQVL
jgi:hypothetical protein